jgi:hypothetical protein
VVVVAGSAWLGLRASAQTRAEDAFLAASALADCIDEAGKGRPLPSALALMLPGERPFATCGESAESLGAAQNELTELPLLREYPPVLELGEVVDRLGKLHWTATAEELARSQEIAKYGADVARAAELACLTAQKVGLDTDRNCAREPRGVPEVPERRTALEAEAKDGAVTAVVAEGSDKDVRIFFATRTAFWYLHSKDAGQTFRHEKLALGGSGERALRIANAVEGRHYAVVTASDRPSPAKILRITAKDRIELARDLELPVDLEWLTGAPVFEVRDGGNLMLALALVETGGGRGRIAYLDNTRIQLRRVPEGRALGAIGVPPCLLIGNPRKKDYEIASYAIPDAIDTWPKPKVATSKPVDELQGLDVTCGAPRERHVPFLWRAEKSGVLVALVDGEPTVYPFERGLGRETRPVCGRCSPSLLATSPRGPELWLPDRRSLTSQRLVAPLLFADKAVWPTARGTCTSDWHALTWISEGRLFVQSVDVGTWQTSPPVLLAETNEWGPPERVTAVATQSGILVFWWRTKRAGQLRVEYATSRDGKTWT